MDSLYSEEHRALQAAFGTEKLADFLDAHHVHPGLTEDDRAFIAGRDMFFLSTVDPDGNPTVSYKGGPTGFVHCLDDHTLAFPGYDGNGMFLSMGNIAGQGRVGLLFIDFETPNRLRVQGTARIAKDDPLRERWNEAQYVVRVDVDKAWVNCPRYIHTYRKVEQSRYVPEPRPRKRRSPAGSASTCCTTCCRAATARGPRTKACSTSTRTRKSSCAAKPDPLPSAEPLG